MNICVHQTGSVALILRPALRPVDTMSRFQSPTGHRNLLFTGPGYIYLQTRPRLTLSSRDAAAADEKLPVFSGLRVALVRHF